MLPFRKDAGGHRSAPHHPASDSSSLTPLVLRAGATCVLAATLVNLGVYGLGRLTDASFLVSPSDGAADLKVGTVTVVFMTLVSVALGVLLLAVAAFVLAAAWVGRRLTT